METPTFVLVGLVSHGRSQISIEKSIMIEKLALNKKFNQNLVLKNTFRSKLGFEKSIFAQLINFRPTLIEFPKIFLVLIPIFVFIC